LRHAEVRVVAILVVRSVIIPVLYVWRAVITLSDSHHQLVADFLCLHILTTECDVERILWHYVHRV